jgi:hypothetical protein
MCVFVSVRFSFRSESSRSVRGDRHGDGPVISGAGVLGREFLAALVVAASTSLGVVATAPAASAAPAPGTVAYGITQLHVASEVRTGYTRDSFRHWIDADRDCQDTRAEVLQVETRIAVTFTSLSRCTVATGRWYSYPDGITWTVAGDVDVDHTVALAEAWDSGARGWTTARRQAYANDMGYAWSLVAMTDNVNASKGDNDPAQWLPPLASARCAYIAYWIGVKYRWNLTIDSAEKSALQRVASGTCGSATLTLPPRA